MKKKILCVDDELNILNILRELLIPEGYDIELAKDAREFQSKAVSFKPDLILLDIMLGDKNGVQLLDDLIKKGHCLQTPVIVLSGLVQEHQISLAGAGRKFAMLAKPFKPAELLGQIKILLAG